ncbi:MAG TPA: hypothetical protein ENI33_06610 [Thermoplasmatales archaeon]|nr:hypothetical protein [Thermoplasmatales archaeon]
MKVCIAYDSKYGNGKKCVEYLHHILNMRGHSSEIGHIDEMHLLPEAEIYIFSSPTHMGSATRKMKKFLKNINGKEGKEYALITTCIDLKNPGTKTLTKMEYILNKKYMRKVCNGIKIKVNGMKGPLEENYKKKIEDFYSLIFGLKNNNFLP